METAWSDAETERSFPPLLAETTADVLVVGGGLTGVLTAYLLARSGRSVVLIERDRIGFGVTLKTTAFVTQAIDTPADELIRMVGIRDAKAIWNAGGEAMTLFGHLVHEHDIRCDFMRCPAFIYAHRNRSMKLLRPQSQAMAELGASATVCDATLRGLETGGYIRLDNQAKFHPLKFLNRLAVIAADAGVRIHEHTEAAAFSDPASAQVVTTKGQVIRSRDTVIATHWPFTNPGPTHWKKAMYRSYVLEAYAPQGTLEEGIYWDTSHPYHYFRVDRVRGSDRIIFGGGDHRSDIPTSESASFRSLENDFRTLMGRTPFVVQRTWRGPILEPSDGLPLIGAYAPNRYVATAFSGNGMTYAAVAARMLCDMLVGDSSPLADVFDPRRPLRMKRLWYKGIDYMGEFFGGTVRTLIRPLLWR